MDRNLFGSAKQYVEEIDKILGRIREEERKRRGQGEEEEQEDEMSNRLVMNYRVEVERYGNLTDNELEEVFGGLAASKVSPVEWIKDQFPLHGDKDYMLDILRLMTEKYGGTEKGSAIMEMSGLLSQLDDERLEKMINKNLGLDATPGQFEDWVESSIKHLSSEKRSPEEAEIGE